MRRSFLILTLLVLSLAVGAVADVPPMISYQGKLMQPSGASVPDGTYSMRFAIYDVPTGGDPLWSETNTSVQVKGGLFATMLGSVINLPANIFDSPNRFFGVKIGDDPEMMPRQQVASSAFAFRAAVAGTVDDGAITTGKVADGAVDTNKLADGAVSTSKIADAAIGTVNIADGAIAGAKIADGSVSADKIANDPASLAKVSGGALVATDGDVGIGTDTPQTRLQVEDTADKGMYVARFTKLGDGPGYVGLRGGNGGGRTYLSFDSDSFGIYTSDSSESGWFHLRLNGDTHTFSTNCDFVAAGTKSAVVDTQNYGRRLLYAAESPENRFFDEGVASTLNGTARVQIDPVFAETVEGDFIVSITPYGDSSLYVSQITDAYFVVRVRSGESDVNFSWRVSATRKGYSGVRLEQPEQ